MLAGAPDHDQERDDRLVRREQEPRNPRQRNQCADPQNLPLRLFVHQRQNENEKQSGHFTEELQQSALELIDSADLRQIVVQYRRKTSCSDSPDENAGEKRNRSRFRDEMIRKLFYGLHTRNSCVEMKNINIPNSAGKTIGLLNLFHKKQLRRNSIFFNFSGGVNPDPPVDFS